MQTALESGSTQRSEKVAALAHWSQSQPATLGTSELQALLDNRVPLIVVPEFASPAECRALSEAAARIGFDPYAFVQPPIDRIGVTAFEYEKISMHEYFEEAKRAREIQRQIFAASFDPIARMRAVIERRAAFQIDVARDPEHGAYYAGLVRRIETGTLLHIDYAPIEQPAWHVSRVQSQLVWNLYTELTPSNPGRTYIYNRPIVEDDARLKIAGTYGYSRDVIRGARCAIYEPKLGDLCFFNTRNFHEVEPSGGRRTTCTSAMGLMAPGQLAIWS